MSPPRYIAREGPSFMASTAAKLACIFSTPDGKFGVRDDVGAYACEADTDLHVPKFEIAVNFLSLEGFKPLDANSLAMAQINNRPYLDGRFDDVHHFRAICWFGRETT